MHLVERFAQYAVGSRTRALTPQVLHHAKRAVIDWFAALLPGAEVPPATLMRQAFASELRQHEGGARLAPGNPGAPARLAALINGTAAHTAEVDDIFRDGIYHPGAPTIAAALALAEERGASGEDFLRAVIVGYEISTRIGATMGRAHYEYWHNTGTIGCFGAAAAAAELLQLDETRFAHALATVATFSAALQQAFRMDSMSKPLHAGRAAEAGITAALMAAEGVTGSLDVLEGAAGFGKALTAGSVGVDWSNTCATLGQDFHITRMTFKNHACCGHTFAAIDGALHLQRTHGLTADEVSSIELGSYRASVEVSGVENPRTPAEGRFSIKYVVATALRYGSVRLAAFERAQLDDPATRVLMGKITAGVDAELDAAFPKQRAARVRITTTDGRVLAHLQATRKGDPDAPLTDTELDDKFRELATPVLGPVRTGALLPYLWQLEAHPTLAQLWRLNQAQTA